MRETTCDVDIHDDETGDQLFSGSLVVMLPKRVDRSKLQLEVMKAGKKAETDPSTYFDFSEKILNDHLVSLDVTHVPSEEKITDREDLEYVEAEKLIAYICQVVSGGKQLGKKTA